MRRDLSTSLVLLACAAAWSFAGPSLFAQEATPPQPRVTMEFKRAELVKVIELLATHGDAKVVVDPGVKGEVTMRFADVPWRKALEAVVKTRGYVLVEEDEGKTLRVVDPSKVQPSMETRVIKFKYIRPDEYRTAKMQTGGADSSKAFTLLDSLRGTLTRRPGGATSAGGSEAPQVLGRLDYYKDGNLIIVVDTKDVLDRMEQVIRELDLEPVEVLLDVTFLTTQNADLIQVLSRWSNPPSGSPVDRTVLKFPFHVGRAQGDFAADAASGTCLDAHEVEATLRLCKRDPDTEYIQRPTMAIASVDRGTRIRFDALLGDTEDNAARPGPGILQVSWNKAAGAARDDSEVYLIPHVVPGTTRVLLTIIPDAHVPDERSSPFEHSSAGATEIAGIDGFPHKDPGILVIHMLIDADQTIVIDGGQTDHPSRAAGEGRVKDVSSAHFFLLITPHIVRGR